jgi:hypothetical protein
MRLFTAVLTLITFASVLPAQNPGQRVQISIRVSSVVTRGDTTGVGAVITSLASSVEELWRYDVDAPAGVLKIVTPAPDSDWNTGTEFWDRSVAHWTILKSFPAGSVTPQFYFESIGLPAIVTYWAGGDYEHGSEADWGATDVILAEDPLVSRMINGKTVGVEPWPADRSPKALIARLRTLTQTSCATPLKWITASSLCTKLLGYLTTAETNRVAGNATKAKSSMASYSKALAGKTAGTYASGVTNPAYWLLKPNADIVVSKL